MHFRKSSLGMGQGRSGTDGEVGNARLHFV